MAVQFADKWPLIQKSRFCESGVKLASRTIFLPRYSVGVRCKYQVAIIVIEWDEVNGWITLNSIFELAKTRIQYIFLHIVRNVQICRVPVRAHRSYTFFVVLVVLYFTIKMPRRYMITSWRDNVCDKILIQFDNINQPVVIKNLIEKWRISLICILLVLISVYALFQAIDGHLEKSRSKMYTLYHL